MGPRILSGLAWVSYAGAVLVLFGATAYFSFSLFVRSGVTRVPELVGATEAEAAARLADQGLSPRGDEAARLFDEEVPAGHVVRQEPAPGSLVKRGSGVQVVISLGKELVEVPELDGQALQAARVTVAALGLSVGRIYGVFSSGGMPGTVVEQAPAPGAQVPRATAVDLFLCLENVADVYLMPDLVYRDHEEVRRFFQARGFRFGNVKFEPYEGTSPGTVLRQFPLAGHPLARNDVISLVVAAAEPRRP